MAAAWYGPGDPAFAPAALPVARSGPAWVVHEGRLFVFGGFDEAWDESAHVHSYDPFTNAWTAHPPLPSVDAMYMQFASVGGLIYGLSYNRAAFYSYDPATGVVTDLTGPSYDTEDGWALDLVAHDGRIYYALTTATPEVYDPATDTWSPISAVGGNNPPTAALARFGSATSDGIYIWTHLYGVVRRYDPAADTWVAGWTNSLSVFSARLGWENLVAVGGKLYMLGGYDADTFDVLGVAWQFDPATDTWTALDPPAGAKRADGAAGVIDGRILVVAGMEDVSFENVADLSMLAESLPLLKHENEYHALQDVVTNAYVNQPARAFLVNRYDSPEVATASLTCGYDNRAYTRRLSNVYGNVEAVTLPPRAVIEAGVKLS